MVLTSLGLVKLSKGKRASAGVGKGRCSFCIGWQVSPVKQRWNKRACYSLIHELVLRWACANSLTNQLVLIAVLRVLSQRGVLSFLDVRRDESGGGCRALNFWARAHAALFAFAALMNASRGARALFNNNCVCCVINFGLKCKTRREKHLSPAEREALWDFTFEASGRISTKGESKRGWIKKGIKIL